LEKKKVKCVRVTGAENEDERKEAQDIFQNLESGTNVIWLTAAGGEAINLQSAKAIIFYDSPWSAGDYLQILGRMIRIGSPNDRCYAIHLVCEDTVDERVMDVLAKKMKLVEGIIGQRLKGEERSETDDNSVITQTSEIGDIFSALQQDARKKK
jgi:SNF2 family DNA or RNA helicase